MTGPGTAATSRPASAAQRAVISEPLLLRRLDHDDDARAARDDPVADREVPRLRTRSGRELGEERAPLEDPRAQPVVRRGIGDVDATAEDAPRLAPLLERRGVRRRVDPVREARDDDDPRPREAGGDEAGGLQPGTGRPARPDEGDGRRVAERPAADEEERRRVGRLAQERGVLRVADGDDARPGGLEAAARRVEARRRRRVEERGDLLRRGSGERRRLRGRTPERRLDRARREEEPREDAGPRSARAEAPRRGRYRRHPLGPHLA